MKYSNTIEYNIKTNLDAKGLTQLKSELQGLELKLQTMGDKGFLDSKTFADARNQLQGLGQALTDAFDPSLGMLNLSALNKELKDNGVSAQGLRTAFGSLGAEGQIAFNNLTGQLGKLDTGLLRTNSQIDKLFTTFSNTFRWGLVSSFFSQFMNAIHSSVDYVKELDDSLTQIMLVTDYNRDSMNEFAKAANEAAKAVSMTTTGMTNASLIFAQQGYDLNQSQQLATLSAKLANASQQDTATTSDQITAYMNAYGLQDSMEELTQQMDNWALIANVSAADVGELAQAAQKAASMANAVGVSGEALAAQIATIESVTREAPEQIGNGLKTLYARFSDIKLGKTDDGVDLGKVTETLDKIGVNVLDKFGNIREMDNILEDLMDVWADLDDTTKLAAGQALAGKYQINRFYALMDNRDMYEQYVGATGSAATGTLDQMNEEFADSIEGRSAKLQASLEGLFSTIFDTDDVYFWMDAAQKAVDVLQEFFDALGGGTNVLLGAVTVLTRMFSNNFAREITNSMTNRAVQQQKMINLQNSNAALSDLGVINPNYMNDKNSQKILDFAQYINQQALEGNFNPEQMNQANGILESMIQNSNAATAAFEKLKVGLEQVGTGITTALNQNGFEDFIDEFGAINQSLLNDYLNSQGPEAFRKTFFELSESLELTQQDLINFNAALQEHQKALDTYGFESEEVAGTTLKLKNVFSEFQGSLNGDTLDHYSQALQEIESGSGDAAEETAKLTSETARLIQEIEDLKNSSFKEKRDKLPQHSFNYRNAQMAMDDDEKLAEAFKKGMGKQANVKNIIDTVNAVQSLTFAWQSFQSLGSLWKNEDISQGEKILQTIMNLTMTISQLIPALQTLMGKDWFAGLKTAQQNLKALQEQYALLQAENGATNFGQQITNAQTNLDQAIGTSYNATRDLKLAREEVARANDVWAKSEEKLRLAQEKLTAAQEDSSRSAQSVAAQKGVLTKSVKAEQKAAEEAAEAQKRLTEAQEAVKKAAVEQTAAGEALTAAEAAETVAAEAEEKAQLKLAAAKKAVRVATMELLASLAIPLAIGGAIAAISALIEKEEELKKAREEAMQAVADETSKTVQEINSTKQSFNELWNEYEKTNNASDEFKAALQEQCDILGITDGSLLITKGKYEELKEKIDAATESVYANNAALLQANLENKSQNPAEQLTPDQQQKIGIQTHTETKQVELNGAGLADMQGNKITQTKTIYDQSAYEQVKAAQDYIVETNEKINNLTKYRLEAAKQGDVEEIEKIDAQLDLWAKDIAVYQQYVENNKDIISAAEQIRDNNLDAELAKTDSIFKTGSRAEIENFIKLIGGETVNPSNIDELVDKYMELANNIEEAYNNALDLTNLDLSTDEISETKATKDPLEKLYAAYDKAKGAFTDDDVAELLAEHAEYIEYLDKEGDHYVLNKRFLDEYTQATRDQTAAIDELQGDTLDLRNEQSYLSQLMQDNGNKYNEIYQKLAEANTKMMQGDLNSEDFLSTANDALNELINQMGKVKGSFDDTAEGVELLSESIDSLDADAIAMVFDELYGGLKLAGKQLRSGRKNIGEYGRELLETTTAAKKFAESIGDTQSVDKFNEILEDGAAEAVTFSEAVTENFNDLSQIFDNNFQVLTDAMDGTGIAEKWRGTMQEMVTASAGFYQQNEEAAAAMAQSLASDLGYTGDQVTTLQQQLQSGSADLTNTLMSNAQAAGTFMSGTANQTQTAISQMANGLTSIIQGTVALIGSVKGEVYGNPEITEGKTTEWVISDGHGNTEKGQMQIPGWKVTVSGHGSSSGGSTGSSGTSSTTWNGKTGQFETTTVKEVDQYGGKRLVSDTRAATYNEITESGAYKNLLTSGLNDLVEGSAQLNQYAPTLPSGTNKAPVRGNDKSGGGNKGKGKGSCFVAGTLVFTSVGFKTIEKIQKGDIVLSYNEKIKINEYSKVLQTMIHDTTEPIYTLHIKDEQLRVTGVHRFLVTNKITCGVPQWVHAADLKVGNWVMFADGSWHVIHKIDINIEHRTVYNFEVSHNHNYYVGRNQILAHNKNGSGKNGKKEKEISTKDKREHEKDYYEKVDSLLEKTDEVLKGIQDKQDKLIGDKARGNQNKQIRLLEKELRILKEKRDILKNQEKRDVRNQIKKDDKAAERVAKKAGVDMKIPDFKRNTDGIITNYEEVSAAVDKTYNAMVDKQKAAAKAGKEELAKNIGEYIDKFDKLSKSLLEGGKRSDEIEAELKKINNEIQDATFNIQDLRIEQFKLYTEARDGLKEALESGAELKKLFRDFDSDSFMNSFSIDDTPYGDLIENMSQLDDIYNITAKDATTFYDNLINQKQEALKTEKDPDTRNALEGAIKFFENRKANISEDGLQNGYLGILTQDLTQLQEWMDNPKAAANLFGMDEASLFENFKDIYDLLLDEFKNYRQLVQETRDNILDIYNDAGEAIERQLDQFDRLSEKMERISDTYTLYYGEDSYDQLDQFYSRQGDIMQNQLNQMTAAYEYWQKAYEEALKVGDKKLIEEMQDRMDDAEDAMLDAAQDLAELWVEKFENAVEASSQHIYKDLFGSNDIDELTDNWELQKDYMDRYKDDVEKAYEIDKLRSKYLDLLDNAQGSSAQTQNRIRQQMQEQLDLLQKQNTVTEYDVKLANAKLEILQKQMALEDAQRNKNKMQLRRDTQGNYRYVYTADQGDVKEAQQDLADSEYDAYEMTKQETVANNDRAISLLQDYVEKRAAIWNKYKDDATARGIALADLESEYDDIFKALAEDFADTSAGMYDVLNWLVKNGSEDTTTAALGMLDTLYDKNGKVKDKTGQDWMDMANLIGDQILPNIVEAVTKADLEMGNQVEDLEDKMVGPGGALTKIGSGADNITDSMGEAANATKDLAAATNNLFAALGADNSELQQALDKLKQYREQLEASQQTTSLLGKALNKANETIKDKNAKESYYQDSIDLMNGSKKFEVGQVVTLKKGTWVSYHRDGDQYDANGNNGFRLSKDTQVKISHVNEHHTKGYGDTSKLAKYNIGFYEASKEATKETGTGLANKSDTKKTERWHLNEDMLRQAITYDTGGYTGQWGGEETNLSKNGKLAVLHQKELVLNATDTENILAAITLMRDMTQNTISGLSTMNRMFKNNFNSSYNPVTEQRVEIQASFPNATDAEDIRAALLNLSDKAYQYANRTI